MRPQGACQAFAPSGLEACGTGAMPHLQRHVVLLGAALCLASARPEAEAHLRPEQQRLARAVRWEVPLYGACDGGDAAFTLAQR